MLKQLFAVTIMAGMLVGCSNSTFDKAVEQSKLSIANEDYDKAMASIELALNEKPNEQKANAIKIDLIAFQLIKKEMKAGQWDSALKQAEDLLQKEELIIGLRNPVEKQVDIVKENLELSAKLSAHLLDIEKSFKLGELKEAQSTIDDLQKSKTTQEVMDNFSEQLASLEKRLETELNKQQETIIKPSKTEVNKLDDKKTGADTQQKYMGKLDSIEHGMTDLDYLYLKGITSDMNQAESERYKRWDVALNEIYGLLKKELSKNEMNLLRAEQRDWIKYRDDSASGSAAEFEGGTFESLTYISTQAELTKLRCYELVTLYMNR